MYYAFIKLNTLRVLMMKKIPVILLALLTPNLAAAQITYDFSGAATGLYGYSNLEKRFDSQEHHSQGTGNLNLNTAINYQYSEDYSLSLNLDLMAGVDHYLKDYNQGNWGEEAYGIFDAPAGRLMLGQTSNVAAQFHQGAPTVGPLGDDNLRITDFIANPNWQRNKKSTGFATLNSTSLNTDGVAPKISYITPEFYNTMLGFSYIPDTYNRRGLVNKFAQYSQDDGYVAALYHSLDLGFVDLAASLGYAQYHDNDQEYSAGLKLTRGGWSLGGSYRRSYIDGRDKSRPQAISERTPELFDNYREGRAWDLGLGYEIGPYQVSLSYFDTQADRTKNSDQIVALSNQYQLNKWLDLYLIGAYAKFKGNTSVIENNRTGYAVISGLSLNF